MKVFRGLLIPLLLCTGVFPQQPVSVKVAPLDRLCGKLVFIKRKPGHTSLASDDQPLKSITIHLYESKGDTGCCQQLSSVEDLVTGRGGAFEFKNTKPGSYWIAATVKGREYKMQVHFQRGKRSDVPCEMQVFEADNFGGFGVVEVITVD